MLFHKSKEMTFSPYDTSTKKINNQVVSKQSSPLIDIQDDNDNDDEQEQLNPSDLYMDYSQQNINNLQKGYYSNQNCQQQYGQFNDLPMNCQSDQLQFDEIPQEMKTNNQSIFMGRYFQQYQHQPQTMKQQNEEQDCSSSLNGNNAIGNSQSYIFDSSRFLDNNHSSFLRNNNSNQTNLNLNENDSHDILNDNCLSSRQNNMKVNNNNNSNIIANQAQEHNGSTYQYCVYQNNQINNQQKNLNNKEGLREQIFKRLEGKTINNEQSSNFYKQRQSDNRYQNDCDKQKQQQKDQTCNQNETPLNKAKQLLFSMVIETPDSRHEFVNVFEGDCAKSLAHDFCVQNNMNLQKYCQFVTNRLQSALNHFQSFQSPKKNTISKKQIIIPQETKFVNNQESAIFQVTQEGILPSNKIKNDNKNQYTSNRPHPNKRVLNNFSYSFEQDECKIKVNAQGNNKTNNNIASPQEQIFELPQKSLIYELDLSNLPDQICYNDYDDQMDAILISNSQQSLQEKHDKSQDIQYICEQIQQPRQIDINSVSAITLTLNPIENSNQDFNQQSQIQQSYYNQHVLNPIEDSTSCLDYQNHIENNLLISNNFNIKDNSIPTSNLLSQIENSSLKINEVLNTNKEFEEQIQSHCQNIESLKQNIQKSLAQQHNIQQDFHRRCNSYSQQYDSVREYKSIDKSIAQKSCSTPAAAADEIESPNPKGVQPLKQIEHVEVEQTSSPVFNHFNHYDILKYQESLESARQSNQNVSKDPCQSNPIDKSELINKDNKSINLSNKSSVKIMSFTDEISNKNISLFEKKDQETNQVQINCINQLSSLQSPSSTNQFSQNYDQQQHNSALFFRQQNLQQHPLLNQNEQYKTQRQNIENIMHENNHNNSENPIQRYNMSSLASQIDDYKCTDYNSHKNISLKYNKQFNSIKEIQQHQQQPQQILNQRKNFIPHSLNNSKIIEGISNFSQIQQENIMSDLESLRIFDKKQEELNGCYKVCQSRIEFDEIINDNILKSSINKNGQQIRVPLHNDLSNVSCFQLADQIEQQDYSNKQSQQQQLNQNKHLFQKIMIFEKDKIQSPVYDNTYIDYSNQMQFNNHLKEIPQISIHNSYNKDSQQNQHQSSYYSASKESKQLSDSYTSLPRQSKPNLISLPPTSSNSKRNSNINEGISSRSTNRNSSCYSSINQNLSSEKRSLFSVNNSQRSLHQSDIKSIQPSPSQQNKSNHQNSILSARGLSYTKQLQSKQQQQQQKSQQLQSQQSYQQQSQSDQKAYDSIPVINQRQQQYGHSSSKSEVERSTENFDKIKQTIFKSIMMSNPSQKLNDVKQIKLNISPFIEQNKVKQQLEVPLNELQNQNSKNQVKPKIQSNTQSSSQSAFKQRNNSSSSIRSSKNNLCQNSEQQKKKTEKRSSSTLAGRHTACQVSKMEQNGQKKGKECENVQVKQNEQGTSTTTTTLYNLSETPFVDHKVSYNQSFKQRVQQIFDALDSDCDGYISFDKIEIRQINDLVLFIITPILIEIYTIKRNINIEEFCCSFLKLFFCLPQQQKDIIIDPNVDITWSENEVTSTLQNLEYFNFNSPLYQQYIDKKNTMLQDCNKAYNWMLDLSNKEFLEFYMSNFKTLVQQTTKYLV